MVLGNSEHSVSSNTVDQLRQLLLPSGFVNTQLDVDDDEGASSLWDVDNGFHSTCTVKKKPETTWNSFKNQLRFLNPWNKSSADFDDIQPTDQRITHALKRIRGSYLTTWWGVHLIISLRQVLWKTRWFGMFLFIIIIIEIIMHYVFPLVPPPIIFVLDFLLFLYFYRETLTKEKDRKKLIKSKQNSLSPFYVTL